MSPTFFRMSPHLIVNFNEVSHIAIDPKPGTEDDEVVPKWVIYIVMKSLDQLTLWTFDNLDDCMEKFNKLNEALLTMYGK